MNVKELKEILKELPDEMEVIQTRWNYYLQMKKSCFNLVQAVDSGNDCLQRPLPSMAEEYIAKKKTYFCIGVN